MATSVLVIEDDKNIQELLQLYLEKEGYAVTVAADGGQGLTKYPNLMESTAVLSNRTSKCRCGASDWPVLPTSPKTVLPRVTLSPTSTKRLDIWAYSVTTRRPLLS